MLEKFMYGLITL